MILPNPKDATHKAWLYRVLKEIYSDKLLGASLYFKGGTCAAMLEYLDRFSVDLDFDYVAKQYDLPKTRKILEQKFKKLGLEIKDKSLKVPQYFLRYPSKDNIRNTLKIDITFPIPKENIYQTKELKDIDRVVVCQTIETMFANKLVALIERYEKNNSIAGRDIYDIHHFFMMGYNYNKAIIIERTGMDLPDFFNKLIEFIKKHITKTIINQDLNYLLSHDKFQQIRMIIKNETIMFLTDEINRV